MPSDIEQGFLDLFEYAQSAIIIFDSEKEIILNANNAAVQLYGFSKDEMTGKPVSILTANHEKGKKYEDSDTIHCNREGTPLTLAVKIIPILYKGVNAIASINRDLSEKKKSEEGLEMSEARYRALVEQQTEMITRWLPNGNFTYVNDIFCTYFNRPRDYFLGKSFIPAMPEEDIKRFEIFFAGLTKDNPTGDFIHRVIMSNGDIKWLKWTDTIILNNEGKIVEYQSVGRDITDRKIAEDRLKESEERYKRLVENVNVINWEFDEANKKFLYVSRHAEKMLGYPLSDWYESGFWFNHLHPEDKEWVKKFITEKAKTGKEYEIEYRFMAADGSYKWFRDITSTSHTDKNLKTLYGIFIDITDKKQADETLKQSEERYKTYIGQSGQGIYRIEFDKPIPEDLPVEKKIEWYSKNAYIAECNLIIAEKWGFNKVDDLIGKHSNEVIKNPNLKLLTSFFINNKLVNFETEEKDKDGNVRYYISNVIGIIENGALARIWGTQSDITEQKKYELKLRHTELRLTAHINTLPNIVFYEAGLKRFMTENVFDLLGYSADYILEDYQRFEDVIHPDDKKIIEKAQNEWMAGKSSDIFTCEFRAKHKSGREIWLEDHMFRIELEDGQEYHSGVLIDITERKRVEEKIRDSLNEKELLIKEIHHRVKNNLQVVSSLLKLQSGYVKDEEARGLLLESQNRVQSMALVHQKLYQSNDLSKIDFREYIQQLLFHLFIVFKVRTSDIKLNVKAESLRIGVDTAVPCGLIINELVSNSLKHAFGTAENCSIDIELTPIDEKRYMLVVSDNGAGFPEHVDFRNTSSLGMQLVITLVSQLDGTIEMENNNGTKFIITFTNIDYKERL